MEFVVDSSVVLRSLLVESDSDAADALVASHRDGFGSLIVPDFICAEVANAL